MVRLSTGRFTRPGKKDRVVATSLGFRRVSVHRWFRYQLETPAPNTIGMLTILTGMAAFAIEAIKPKPPNSNLGKETKQQCPLCRGEKKLKELRGHVGLHILRCLLDIDEDLTTKVAIFPLQPPLDADLDARLGRILADSVVANCATLVSLLPEASDRFNRIVGFSPHSSTAQPRILRKTRRARTSPSTVLTVQRRCGSTMLLTISCLGTKTFSTPPISTLVLSSIFSLGRVKKR